MNADFGTLLLTSIVAGFAGIVALELTMWLITRKGWAQGNMIIALGSLLTRSRQNAFVTGALLHLVSGIGFAFLYAIAMGKLGFTHLPASLIAGVVFGSFHGLIVSLMLVWVVAEQHPLEEFTDAGLAVGVSHVAGHVAFGAAVGLVIGLSAM
jgi:hypothetical protein